MDQKQKEELIERLAQYPELYEQIAGLLDEVENRSGAILTADDAEGKLIERMRQIGNLSLNNWAKTSCEKLNARAPAGGRQATQKKSHG